jgi:hypothetical protein
LQRTCGYGTTPFAVAEGPVLGSKIANKIKRLVLTHCEKKTGPGAVRGKRLTLSGAPSS